jgi:hypothetical protein
VEDVTTDDEPLDDEPTDEPTDDDPIDDDRHAVDTQVEEEMTELAHETWKSLTGPTGYLPVLLMLIGVMMAGPLAGNTYVGSFFTAMFSAGTLLMTVFRSTSRPQLRRSATALVAVLTSGAIVAGYIHHLRDESLKVNDVRWAEIIFIGFYLVLLVIALPLVLARAFGHRRVSLNTVCATVSGYLIIGLIFTSLYRIIGGFQQFFVQVPNPTLGDYSYFSFISLTTTGFGDLTAKTDPQRAAVMLEVVMGQIFVVTAVARVVSLLGSVRPPVERLEEERER